MNTRSKAKNKNKASWKKPEPWQLQDPDEISTPSHIDYPSDPPSSSSGSVTATPSSFGYVFDSSQKEKVPDYPPKTLAERQADVDKLLATLNNWSPSASYYGDGHGTSTVSPAGQTASAAGPETVDTVAAMTSVGPDTTLPTGESEATVTSTAGEEATVKTVAGSSQGKKNTLEKKRKTTDTAPKQSVTEGPSQQKKDGQEKNRKKTATAGAADPDRRKNTKVQEQRVRKTSTVSLAGHTASVSRPETVNTVTAMATVGPDTIVTTLPTAGSEVTVASIAGPQAAVKTVAGSQRKKNTPEDKRKTTETTQDQAATEEPSHPKKDGEEKKRKKLETAGEQAAVAGPDRRKNIKQVQESGERKISTVLPASAVGPNTVDTVSANSTAGSASDTIATTLPAHESGATVTALAIAGPDNIVKIAHTARSVATVKAVAGSSQGKKNTPENKRKTTDAAPKQSATEGPSQQKMDGQEENRKKTATAGEQAAAAGPDRRKNMKVEKFFAMKLKQIVNGTYFQQKCKKMLEEDAPPFAVAADSMGLLFGKEMKLAMANFRYEDDGRDFK